jgi:hypothetical protein
MAGASRRLTAAAVAALLLAGCAGSDDETVAARRADSEGFTWAGQGEPTNFGSDYNFCSRNTSSVGRPQGATSTIAANGTDRNSSEAFGVRRMGASRSNFADKRLFWVCMESRGWQLAGAR